jgi:hypothetical protein
MSPVVLQAIFSKATTTIDGGWNITFSCGEDMAEAIMDASRLRDIGLFLILMTEAEYRAQTRSPEPRKKRDTGGGHS